MENEHQIFAVYKRLKQFCWLINHWYKFPAGAIAYYNSAFGSGDGPIAYSYVDCEGHEGSFAECTKSTYLQIYTCYNTDTAGVLCVDGETIYHNQKYIYISGDIFPSILGCFTFFTYFIYNRNISHLYLAIYYMYMHIYMYMQPCTFTLVNTCNNTWLWDGPSQAPMRVGVNALRPRVHVYAIRLQLYGNYMCRL